MTDYDQWPPVRGSVADPSASSNGHDTNARSDEERVIAARASRAGENGKAEKKKDKKNGRAGALKRRYAALKSNGYARSADARHVMIGSCPAIRKLREEIALFAPEDDPVLIMGETGTGKELIAREIHEQSAVRDGPMIVRNVGRIDRELLGSDFFGHEKGAFTGASDKRVGVFEQADGGSLHLDEIAELPLDLQANLLRVVEDGEVFPLGGHKPKNVRVRLISATNVNLLDAVENHRFREDLFYRLNGLPLWSPPLRERGDDLFEIAEYALYERGLKKGKTATLSASARKRLKSYSWPGNVRELKSVLSTAAVRARDGVIEAEHISLKAPHGEAPVGNFDVKECNELVTHFLAAKALQATGGNVSRAALLTNMSRDKFHQLKNSKDLESADLGVLARELREILRIC